jgi:hypothetical protein
MNFNILQNNKHYDELHEQFRFYPTHPEVDDHFDGREWYLYLHDRDVLISDDYCTDLIFKYTTP